MVQEEEEEQLDNEAGDEAAEAAEEYEYGPEDYLIAVGKAVSKKSSETVEEQFL